ncbi:hypothetical protein LTR37_018065 [Vermiconidia calcicola]|uniref:Uncharacterized protein n=1 Tax=Vermiconidia calcicola TaxID=1690605 RepID=A0ACC3MI04_9PEZI|nr:hypothetical protein LTR37_018065 [Vermiconidia calcicola]
MASAVSKVLAIPELLEQILSALSKSYDDENNQLTWILCQPSSDKYAKEAPLKKLCILLRVNKTFRSTIQQSPSLQRTMCLQQAPNQDRSIRILNPLLQNRCLESCSVRYRWDCCVPSLRYGDEDAHKICLLCAINFPGHSDMYDRESLSHSYVPSESIELQEFGCWRDMLVSLNDRKLQVIVEMFLPQRDNDYDMWVVEFVLPEKATLGRLVVAFTLTFAAMQRTTTEQGHQKQYGVSDSMSIDGIEFTATLNQYYTHG